MYSGQSGKKYFFCPHRDALWLWEVKDKADRDIVVWIACRLKWHVTLISPICYCHYVSPIKAVLTCKCLFSLNKKYSLMMIRAKLVSFFLFSLCSRHAVSDSSRYAQSVWGRLSLGVALRPLLMSGWRWSIQLHFTTQQTLSESVCLTSGAPVPLYMLLQSSRESRETIILAILEWWKLLITVLSKSNAVWIMKTTLICGCVVRTSGMCMTAMSDF